MNRLLIVLAALAGFGLAETRSATLFQDDFAVDTGVWAGYDGGFGRAGQACFLSGSVDGRLVAFPDIDSWQDYSVSADFKVTAGFSAAILFHVRDAKPGTDQGHYYQFYYNYNGNTGFHEIDNPGIGVHQLVGMISTGYDLNTNHKMSVTVKGGTATGYLDGAPIITCSGFTKFTHGGIGLKAFGSAVLFDNVLVSDTTPDPGPPEIGIHPAIELTWTGLSNATYQVQWTSDIASNRWTNLGLPVVGAGGIVSVFDSTRGDGKRYYRVWRLN